MYLQENCCLRPQPWLSFPSWLVRIAGQPTASCGAVIAVLIILTGMITPLRAEPSADDAQTRVQLVIDFGDGFQKRYTQLAWKENMTVLDAMNQAAEHPRGIEFQFRGRAATAFLTSIDGQENEGRQRNWMYRVNGQLGTRSFAIYRLSPDDVVVWTFAESP